MSRKRGPVPRASRIHIHPLSGIAFALSGPGAKIEFEVVNLSETGVGLCNAPVLRVPARGSVLTGRMLMPGGSYPLVLKVVHASKTAIGCAYVGGSTELQKQVEQHFRIEMAAMSLVEVDPDQRGGAGGGRPRLFRGTNNSELFIVEGRGDEIERFQLSFFGNYVEGGAGMKTRCGFLAARQGPSQAGGGGPSLVRLASHLSPEVVRAASSFLDHIPHLSAAQRGALRLAIRKAEASTRP